MNALTPDPLDLPVVAIVGATGVVGQALIDSLLRRSFPLQQLRLLASPRSAGTAMQFGSQTIGVEALNKSSFKDVDIAFFSAGAAISREFAPVAVAAGAQVIDNSSAFRMDADVPLIVPEANAHALEKDAPIVANPNCIAAILTTALAPLHAAWSITRLSLTTYQAASGGGAVMMDELE
ncbi:MAG: aspartate-semialdehyde dehydrogenase, partial [Pseudomonadota bacterium]